MTPIARAFVLTAAVGAALLIPDIVHAAGLTGWDENMAGVATDAVGAGYYIGVVAIVLVGLFIALQAQSTLTFMTSIALGAGLMSRADQVMAAFGGGGGGGGVLDHVTPWVQAVPF